MKAVSVSPSLVLNDSTAAVVAAPTDAPIVGKPARKLASAQGYCWEAIEQTVAIASHGESFTTVDAQGDALAGLLAQLLARLAASARREGAHQTAAMAQEAVAVFARMLEMDAAEDWHVGQMAARAVHATGSSRQASSTIGAVLGQHDALCGRTRGEAGGIEFEPCRQPAGHALDGKVCVFVTRERRPNWTPGPNLRQMGEPVGGRAQRMPRGSWSSQHAACVACHRDTVPHAGHGLCRTCYPKARLAAQSQEG